MRCKACGSENVKTLTGELGIHFPGREGLTKPLVWVFPRLGVCLSCGSTNFTVPQEQLTLLEQGLASPDVGAGDALRK